MKEASTFYQLNCSMLRLGGPQTAPKPIGTLEVWLTRLGAGGNVSVVSTSSNIQVKVLDRSVITDAMDDKVDGSQYKFVFLFLNGTIVYETNWITARLGSES